MPDQIVNIILLFAAGQGFFLAVVIMRKYYRLYANRFLAMLVLLCGIILLSLYWSETHSDYRFSLFNVFFIGISFLVNPLQYLYTRYVLQQNERFKPRHLVHVLPTMVWWLTLLPFVFSSPDQLSIDLKEWTFHGVAWRFILFNIALMLSGIIYMSINLYKLHIYRKGLTRVLSSIDEMRLLWLRNFTLLALSSWVLFCLEIIVFFSFDLENYGFGISSAFSGVFIYLLGYWGLLKSEWLLQPRVAQKIEQVAQELTLAEPESNATPRYEKSGLSDEKAKQYLDDLLLVMEKERPWLNSDLTLQQLAELVSISPHNLSEVLNTRLQVTFFDFINQYRIAQVKKDLTDAKKQSEKILAIAFDAGFNSKTAFNTIFKKHTGLTPSEYREKLN